VSTRARKPEPRLAYRDTRTAGQRRADARNWANPPHRPLTQINRRREPEPVPAAIKAWQFWACVIAWCACMAGACWLARWL